MMAAPRGAYAKPGIRTLGIAGVEWHNRAACRDKDPELFFPVGRGGRPTELQIEKARTVCAACPARSECLQWALDGEPVEGIWGGTTEGERARIIRARNYEERTR
jgi:WhiB family transcriptional regulator, redox-sensing transcriptional regulator